MFIVRRSELAKPLHAWLFLTVNGSCIYFANLRLLFILDKRAKLVYTNIVRLN